MNKFILSPIALLLITLFPSCSMFQKCLFKKSTSIMYKINNLSCKEATIGEDRLVYFDSHSSMSHVQKRETIVLIHGVTADKDSWLRLVGKLRKDYRVIAIDVPGHGDSATPTDKNYTFARQAQRTRALIERLGIKKVHLLGHSMGGGIAMQFAVLYPEKTTSLGLISTAGAENQETTKFNDTSSQIHNPLIISDEWSSCDRPFLKS